MPDPIFAHPRLAAIYDAFDGDRLDLAAYLDIADELGADRILDVGCGTGSLALLFAQDGRRVVGVDPAEASLAIAKSKPGAARITWIHGDATAAPALDADLAIMTGNVAQVFRSDDDWGTTLQGIHRAVRPGGHLVFETRRPDARAWEEWAADLHLPGRRHGDHVGLDTPVPRSPRDRVQPRRHRLPRPGGATGSRPPWSRVRLHCRTDSE